MFINVYHAPILQLSQFNGGMVHAQKNVILLPVNVQETFDRFSQNKENFLM